LAPFLASSSSSELMLVERSRIITRSSGSVGGPLIREKLFFFTTFDQYRKVTPIAYTSTANNPPSTTPPTPNLAGLFTTYDAATNPKGSCPAAITAAQCTAARDLILNENLGTFPRLLKQDVELVKLDYQLGTANHFNVVANVRDWRQPNGTAFASSKETAVPASGWGIPSEERSALKRFRSSARSMASGLVPRIRTPAR